MEPLAYYMSHVLDPYADDALADQSDVNNYWYLQYKKDSIINSLGTKELSTNIDLFLDDIEKNFDQDNLNEFYQILFQKIIEIYHMDCLEDHCFNKRAFDYNKEVKSLLMFLHKDCQDFLVKILKKTFDIDIQINEQYIKKNFSILQKEIGFVFKDLPYLVQYFMYYDTTENRSFFLALLVKNNYYNLLTKLI